MLLPSKVGGNQLSRMQGDIRFPLRCRYTWLATPHFPFFFSDNTFLSHSAFFLVTITDLQHTFSVVHHCFQMKVGSQRPVMNLVMKLALVCLLFSALPHAGLCKWGGKDLLWFFSSWSHEAMYSVLLVSINYFYSHSYWSGHIQQFVHENTHLRRFSPLQVSSDNMWQSQKVCANRCPGSKSNTMQVKIICDCFF